MSTQDTPPIIARSVRFSLSHWDVLRCRLWVVAHNRILVTIILLTCVGMSLATLSPIDGVRNSFAYSITYMVLMTGLMVCFMAAVQVVFQAVWLFLNKNRGVLGDHELEIRDDGLLERTSVNESLHRWAGFHKIGSSSNYLFVFVTDNNVQYVPLRCFASAEDSKRFRDELQKRANAA